MKNNKKSPLTLARQATFIEEFGADFKTVTAPTDEFKALCLELVGVDTEEMKQNRIACESTAQGYRENSPELYGRSSTPMFPNGMPVLHGGGNSCDLELSEMEKTVVSSMGHNQELSDSVQRN